MTRRRMLAVGQLAIPVVLGYLAWYQSYDFTAVLLLIAVWSIAGVGLGLVLGGAGQIALCQATFVLLGAYAYAVPARELGWPPMLALGMAALVGAAAALLISPVLRITGYLLAVATIAVALLVERAFKTGTWLPGGTSGLIGVPPLRVGELTVEGPTANLAVASALLAVAIVAGFLLFGRGATRRDIALVHHDEGLLSAFGGSVPGLKRRLFVTSGLLGGVAGGVYAAAYGFIRPEGFGFNESFVLALAVFIGGRGRLLGAVLGVAIYQFSYPVLGADLADYRFAVLGVLVIVITHLSPRGLLPSGSEIWRRRRTPHHVRATSNLPVAPPPVALPPPPSIEVTGLVKRYGAVAAVDSLSVTVPAGALVALVGPNGAGKTTLLDLIAGEQRADAGEVYFGGTAVGALRPEQRARLGLGRTFQRIRLVPELTVLENVMVGADRSGRSSGHRAAEAARTARALDALAVVGLADRADTEIGELTFADRRLVEMARLVTAAPRIALLDEPSSGLNDVEAEQFAELVRALHGRGTTIVLVEHNLPFVRSLAEHVIALDEGRLLASGPTEEVFAAPAFAASYLGVPA